MQVEYDGSWVNVDDPRNAGRQHQRLLEPASNGYLRATVLRVVKSPAGAERISVPVFFSARLDGTGGAGARTGSDPDNP
ncbi:hypothetical protein [Mesorhizobium sp.]|uniref:hypothetical protein n=1 Tax=Mesorhizobium sp. TaxID=1871066 RepID=UPI00345B6C6A